MVAFEAFLVQLFMILTFSLASFTLIFFFKRITLFLTNSIDLLSHLPVFKSLTRPSVTLKRVSLLPWLLFESGTCFLVDIRCSWVAACCWVLWVGGGGGGGCCWIRFKFGKLGLKYMILL